MSLAGKTIPRRLQRLTSFSIVTARLELAGDASSALCADKRNPPAQRAGPLGPIRFVDSLRAARRPLRHLPGTAQHRPGKRFASLETYHAPGAPAICPSCGDALAWHPRSESL